MRDGGLSYGIGCSAMGVKGGGGCSSGSLTGPGAWWSRHRMRPAGWTGTEHILLGVISQGEGVASQVLTGLGADLDGVREQVVRLLDEYRRRQHGEGEGAG